MHGTRNNGANACITRSFLIAGRFLFKSLYARRSSANVHIARPKNEESPA